MMQDYEKLGLFYLGKLYDLEAKRAIDDLLLYTSKDLVTHAAVLGMTGSGKTGLCIGLIEEAAIDGIPSILIDPKGDLSNLLLTFPNLQAEDFLPWVNLDEARQKGLTPQEHASAQAQLWADGLGRWDQSGERIRLLRESADFRIYTPASGAGIPVSIMKSFAAPPVEIMEDAELIRERIGTTVTSLLGLVGIVADPVQSREFILLSTIIEHVWRQGLDLDLAQLITQVQNPPVSRIGVLDLESFYPSKDRFTLMMALNNLLASPGFSAWLEGEPLDIDSILYSPEGKPRVAIFSIAHLNDAQRMFFVSLLLNQVLGWMRTQTGTTSLRALLYIDELFGYLPPTSNPPSKTPLLTLLKQARAFGLGLVLATQNPVDLDYKALSNIGTWFIGRLQTERDKARLMDGLEGAAISAGAEFNRRDLERTISGLSNRVFLLNNTHEDRPVLMTTRWVLSYLRGPLSREQIRTLMAPVKNAHAPVQRAEAAQAEVVPASTPLQQAPEPPLAPEQSAPKAVRSATALPPDIQQFYLPIRGRVPAGYELLYLPQLYGSARVAFSDTKSRVNTARACQFITPISESAIAVDWHSAEPIETVVTELEKQPAALSSGAPQYGPLPSEAGKARNYTAWQRDFANFLYGTEVLELLYSPSQKLYSAVDEDERDFRIRLSQSAREGRDAAVEALRKKYAPKLTTLEDRLRRAHQAVAREKEQARQAGMQAAISVGATILGAFTGRKTSSLGRATTAARGVSRSVSQSQDIGRAGDTVKAIEKQIADLSAAFEAESEELANRIDPMTEVLQTITIKPKKVDITIQLVALTWAPYWQDASGQLEPAW
jgi:hypothetical protein